MSTPDENLGLPFGADAPFDDWAALGSTPGDSAHSPDDPALLPEDAFLPDAVSGASAPSGPGPGSGAVAVAVAESTLSAREIARLIGRHEPTDEQVAVIEAPLEPTLVVAGAGSGKTETMAARVVWLIANALVEPEQVLGLTFTRKAAGELQTRVTSRLAQLARARARTGHGPASAADAAIDLLARPTVATYNAYAASLVTDHGLRLGVEPGSRLLGEANQWQLANQLVESWDEDLGTDRAVSGVVGAVIGLSAELGEHLVDVDDARAALDAMIERLGALPLGPRQRTRGADNEKLLRSLAERRALLDLVAEYRRRKRGADALDFGDQIAFAAELARSVPHVGEVERARFRVVLLDEYQDTSYAQVELLAGLFGGGHAVTAVGDPHQSIYGWRGASASGLARFPERFRHADGAPAGVRYLSTSWRNDAAVLAAANVASAPLRESLTTHVPPLDLRPGAGAGVVTAHVATTLEEEAASVAEWVADRWRPGTHPDGRVTAAVLCRARSQFAAVEVALRRRGLPVEVVGLGGLLSTPEVVDVVALLEAVHDPSRGDSLLRLLTGPRVNLGAADLHALGSRAADLAREDDPRRAAERGRPGRAADDDAAGRAAADAAGRAAADAAGRAVAADGVERGADEGRPANPGHAAKPVDTPDDTQAVDDLAVVEGDVVDHRSLVDALDDLPEPGRPARDGRLLTPAAHARLTALRSVLRGLRGLTYLSLPELVVQAERALGLDVEVATADAVAALVPDAGERVSRRGREHLDAFRDVAATFAQSADVATLGAFLAWLGVAQKQERGLDLPVREPDPDAVQVITAHAAKGLEWDVVAVPGLVDGVFPTVAETTTGQRTDSGWLTDAGALPYPLRGDAADLPAFRWDAAADTKELDARRTEFRVACGEHALAEERRLAYVAFTRARRELLLTAHWWGTGSRARRVSPFLVELAEAGLVATDGWTPAPDAAAANPRDDVEVTASWPADDVEHGSPRDVLRATAALVDAAAAARAQGLARARAARSTQPGPDATAAPRTGRAGGPTGDRAGAPTVPDPATVHGSPAPDDPQVLAPAGVLLDATGHDVVELARLLLAERDERSGREVEMPAHVSASGLVRLATDRDEFALQLRRPVPAQPTVHARRGTRFHAWVEQHFTASSLLDVEDLPGADDDDLRADADLDTLKEKFLASAWAGRTPVAIEQDVETPLAGIMTRSRMDAVFPDPDGAPGAVVVVDWKTGRPPADAAARTAREVQLAVYRLAWSRWAGLPLDQVSAAFCYVATGETVRPERLATEEELEALVRGS
ncbi:ATP-dependent DNA helicase [Xylanimonas protaetiae]|uniref:DNA 3'-5' helicase n=1 Tax=Xylanimonas protaetiae TaxID=2509457 RepID=A0A4P6F3M7_9MICO|nr:ATP-dependent DNA helicase [Xylanimonas protaetiae]QAY70212.1 ATP-dependent helicase [Xylanimonas protaetiae]